MSKSIYWIVALAAVGIGCAQATVAQTVTAEPAPSAAAQSPSPDKTSPRRPVTRRPPDLPARVTVIPNETQLAPQVVTVVHRLTGVQILRLLQRQSAETFTIENIDPRTLMSDAHASILAGWALDDGKTIATRLPQAFAELDIDDHVDVRVPTTAPCAAGEMTLTAAPIEPDLTVITGDGQKFRARLVGIDGETGLSVLQLLRSMPPPPPPKSATLKPGEGIQIFSPEPVANESETLARTTYVKVGASEATVVTLAAPDSTTPGLLVRGGKMSPALVGGIACDRLGNTIGIVQSIEGNEARIVSAAAVQAATKRVLDRQTSVPRAWLGVRGEAIDLAGATELLAHGWRNEQVKALMNDSIGILLTAVIPKSPAAIAKLQAGDVILSVNQTEVKTTDQFSDVMGKANVGDEFQFTIKRPTIANSFDVPVKLGSAYAVDWTFRFADPSAPLFGLQRWGIHTLGLTDKAAFGFGAQNGLIVVAVRPNSAAARSGIRAGDVIESIDGRAMAGRGLALTFAPQKKHTVSIVRDREKKQLVLEVEE